MDPEETFFKVSPKSVFRNMRNFFTGNSTNETELLSNEVGEVNKKKNDKTSAQSVIDSFQADEEDNFDGIENCRNLIVSPSMLFRKGPIPIESLSQLEQKRLSKLACLKEWDDSDIATSDNNQEDIQENPVSKSLLTYFARFVL